MMEFGHNDQKRRNLKAFDQYASNLRWYIKQIRNKGAYPIIVTPLSRIPAMDDRGYYDLLKDYSESCIRIGAECGVPVIDLHSYSFRLLCDMGADASKNYFNDITHTNDYGALMMADFFAEEIIKQEIEPLYSQIQRLTSEQWKPDLSLRTAGTISSVEIEEQPILSINLPELPYEDCQCIPQKELLKEAMTMGLLDPCIKFFHPFEGMPRGQFLYLLSKAVKSFGNPIYDGRYCDIYRYEFDAKLVQAALDENLIDENTTLDDKFRPDDFLCEGELVSFVMRAVHKPEERNLSMEQCEAEALREGSLWEGYQRENRVNRLQSVVILVWLMKRLVS